LKPLWVLKVNLTLNLNVLGMLNVQVLGTCTLRFRVFKQEDNGDERQW
jgi:hypothetical protein